MNKDKTILARWSVVLSLLFLFVLSACGGGGNGSNSDTTAPAVISTTPENFASTVARNSSFTATFNESIFAATVNTDSFTLAKSGTADIPGSVSFDSANNVAGFTPNSPLVFLATYTATLSTAITDLSGNALAANYSWSFTTADGAWGDAAQLDIGNVGSVQPEQIAFDNNGNAIAVWLQSDGTRNDIWANRFNGSNWGNAVLIEADIGDSSSPQIAVDNNGNAIAVWRQRDGTHSNIRAKHFDGSGWGSAVLIETNNIGAVTIPPKIIIDNNGNAIAVWGQHDFSDGGRSIWASRFDDNSWDSAKPITGSQVRGNAPKIVFDNNGNALMVWVQHDGTRYGFWAKRFDGSRWGSAVPIEGDNTDFSGGTFAFDIDFDDNGNAIAVWQLGNSNIWANRFDGSDWGSPVQLNPGTGTGTFYPKIAVDSNGNAIAVWRLLDGGRTDVWANRFDGRNWGSAGSITIGNPTSATGSQIAFDNNGKALVVWQQSDGTRSNIWANRFDGSSWGTAALIETENAGDALRPQITFDNNGNAIAVWLQSDGTDTSIWANRFGNDPVKALDSDGDGITNDEDMFPYDASESRDNDKDGIGDNADTDDDNDGVLDINDAYPNDPTKTDNPDNCELIQGNTHKTLICNNEVVTVNLSNNMSFFYYCLEGCSYQATANDVLPISGEFSVLQTDWIRWEMHKYVYSGEPEYTYLRRYRLSKIIRDDASSYGSREYYFADWNGLDGSMERRLLVHSYNNYFITEEGTEFTEIACNPDDVDNNSISVTVLNNGSWDYVSGSFLLSTCPTSVDIPSIEVEPVQE